MTVSAAGSSGSSTTSSSSSVTSAISSSLSNIDWNALIQSQVNAKLASTTAIQTKIDNNNAKVSAYQNFQTLLSSLATATQALNAATAGNRSTSAFNARAAEITGNGNVNASSIVDLSLQGGAPVGDYTLEVGQLAQAHKVAGIVSGDSTTALGLNGSFSIGLDGGAAASVTVTANMTLGDIVAAINNTTGTTNVQASIVQVSSGQSEIVLTATQAAANITTSVVSGDDVLNQLGLTDGSGNFTDVLRAAQPAQFTLDGISLTRNTNDISDVLQGVTFHLMQPTPAGTSVNINIDTDTDQITTAMQSFVSAYNAVRDFVVSQQATNADGTASSDAVLFGDSTLRGIMSQMQAAVNTTVNGMSLNDLGLSFNTSNELVLDSSTLSTALSTNLAGVEDLLTSDATTSSANLRTIAAGGGISTPFVVNIAVDGLGNVTSASVNGDSSLFSISGNTLVGKVGTAYQGMAFAFTGTTSEAVTITPTIGIAALINSIASTNSNPLSGSLQTLVNNLQQQDTTYQQKISDIQQQAAAYQGQLQAQYAKYQAAIQQANNTLNFLSALLQQKSS